MVKVCCSLYRQPFFAQGIPLNIKVVLKIKIHQCFLGLTKNSLVELNWRDSVPQIIILVYGLYTAPVQIFS